MNTIYSVTLLDKRTGCETVSRYFQELRAARRWARWLNNVRCEAVTIWRGEPGGERVE